jgi:hypothetical protein
MLDGIAWSNEIIAHFARGEIMERLDSRLLPVAVLNERRRLAAAVVAVPFAGTRPQPDQLGHAA